MFQHGVCLDLVNSVGDTALQCAIKHGSLLSALMLIQAVSDQHFIHVWSLLNCIPVKFL